MPQGARVPQDVVEHVAVRVDDALRGAGRSGREVDVRDGVRWDVDRGRRMSRPPQEVVDEERRSPRPGHRRGDGRGPPVGEDEASAHGVRHLAQPRRRVRRVERDVGLAGPQGPEGRRDVREPLVQDEHDRLPPGAQALDERAGDLARQLVEPAVGHAVGAVGHGEAVPMGRNHPPEPGRQRLLHPLRPEDRGAVLATPVLIAGHRPAPRPRARWWETPLTRGPRVSGEERFEPPTSWARSVRSHGRAAPGVAESLPRAPALGSTLGSPSCDRLLPPCAAICPSSPRCLVAAGRG